MIQCRALVLQLCFIVAFIVVLSSVNAHNECLLHSTNVSEIREPLYLRYSSTRQLQFYLPNDNRFALKNDEEIELFCPNIKNSLLQSKSNVTKAICHNGKLEVSGNLYRSSELECNKSIRGEVKRTTKQCGNTHGYLSQIGYNTGRNEEFLTLIEVCYDDVKGSTLYADHVIYGDSIRNASKSKVRPAFSAQGISIGAGVAYKQAYQRATFSHLLGSPLISANYINDKSFLSRGHLAPDADFLFAPWQYATYFYINTAPQWQVINGGNWHRVESMTRKLSANLADTLRILTGTFGILSLPGATGTRIPIYLLPKSKLPVPQYIWKLIYRPKTHAAIVLVVLNNPFIKEEHEAHFCPDVCKDTEWYDDNWRRPDKGIVQCCEYDAFRRTVPNVPTVVVKGALRGPRGRH